MQRAVLAILLLLAGLPAALAELPAESTGKVETLAVPYPAHWFWVQDIAFDHMMDGKVILLDARGEDVPRQVKGMFNAAFIAAFAQSTRRPEVYVAETFYDRINRGKRTDVVSVYDKRTLAPVAEIVLPNSNRAQAMPGRYSLVHTNDESLLLAFTLTPATGVVVIDPVARKVLNEIPTPVCALMFPTGKRGFSTLCSNASMISFQLGTDGKVTGQSVIDPFFDIEQDALFEKPIIVDGMGYFPTFQGNVQEIDLRGDAAKLGERWNLVPEADRAGNWRPGGAQITARDDAGRIYLLMHPDGHEGTHKEGGPEVWVYDTAKRTRVQRVKLREWGIAIEVTRGKEPLLLVTNAEMNIDAYEAGTGKHLRTLSGFGQETPILLHATR